MNLDEMPTVLDVPVAARMLGIGRTTAYALVRAGDWPTPIIRVGRLIKVPTGPLLELLELQDLKHPTSRPALVLPPRTDAPPLLDSLSLAGSPVGGRR